MQNVKYKGEISAASDIETPLPLCKFLTDVILSVMSPKVILDPSAGDGNLTTYFPDAEIISYEIKKGRDFFDCTKSDCQNVDLVICNPPFNGAGGKKLFPEVFLKHILEVVPPNTPIAFITPIGLRFNVRRESARHRFMSMLEITSFVTLPLDVFQNVLFHTEILIFNLKRLKPHYSYHPNTEIKKRQANINLLETKLEKFVSLSDKTFMSATRTIANAYGLQANAGNLLAAIIYKVDSTGCITINAASRNKLALMINTTEQVITNQIRALCDTNLLIKEGKGCYFYNVLSVGDCRKIIEGDYEDISVDMKYYKNELLPDFQLIIE